MELTSWCEAMYSFWSAKQRLSARERTSAAIMIQENWDASVPTDVVNFLRKLAPPGVWLHDQHDANGDAHIKAGLVGPSETIPVIDGKLGLSRWQGVFFCEFDGPRPKRPVVVTVIADRG
ncbi:MAG: hypothetical protein A3G81_12310 [Betaproteobacteria bacterium RIFCSPLOWO2_12_FULL_65_14]|nr:MAG: hypothetical protein A3G81_12310 [Betaproteobacteria bacterium RIFCSPLOWO2_12_FULL_65_14]